MERGVEWATARLVVAGTGIYRQPGQRTAGSEPVLGNLKTSRTIIGLEQLFIRAPCGGGAPLKCCVSHATDFCDARFAGGPDAGGALATVGPRSHERLKTS